jgi:hypothetical protein
LDESRKIDPEELKSKREGSFITGLPSVSSDPVTGIWYGGSGYYIENGKKTNSLFAYSPYVYRISADIYQSSVGAKYYGAGIDLPYFRESPYRINFYSFYDRNLRGQYYGVGESTLKPLSYHPRNDDSQPIVTNAEFDKREEALSYRRPSRGSATKTAVSIEPNANTGKRHLLTNRIHLHFPVTPLNSCLRLDTAFRQEFKGRFKGYRKPKGYSTSLSIFATRALASATGTPECRSVS